MAHELMHKLMAKFVRHDGIDSADLSKIGSTDGLWLSEGGVEWASMALERAAGLNTPKAFVSLLQDQYRKYQQDYSVDPSNGRENSFDAHIGNSSFYNKGAVTTSLLDLQIKAETHGQKGLFDVFKDMKDEFGGNGKFWNLDDMERICRQTVATPASQTRISSFFNDYLRDHKRFDFDAILGQAGYRLSEVQNQWEPGQLQLGPTALQSDSSGQLSLAATTTTPATGEQSLPAYGITLARSASGEVKLASVVPGSSAYKQGMNDFIGLPVLAAQATASQNPQGNIDALTFQFKTQDTFSGQSQIQSVQVRPQPASKFVLQADPQPTPLQLAVRQAWIGL